MLKGNDGRFVLGGVCRSFQPQNQFELAPVDFDLFQNDGGVRLVRFENIIGVANHLGEKFSKEFKIIRVTLFDVFNLFVGYYDVVACNVFGDDAVKFPVELADEVQRLSPEKNIFVAVQLVKKIFCARQLLDAQSQRL